MAKTTTLVDDVDGSNGAVERLFSIGGTEYAIDLNEANYAKLLKAIEPWRSRARIAKQRRNNPAPVLSADDRQKIREWAAATGRHLAPRGRFPTDLVREYYEMVGSTLIDLTLDHEEYRELVGAG